MMEGNPQDYTEFYSRGGKPIPYERELEPPRQESPADATVISQQDLPMLCEQDLTPDQE